MASLGTSSRSWSLIIMCRVWGIVTLILLVFITGLFAANFIGRQIVKLWEGWLNRVPLVRGIYSTLKSMMDILSSRIGSHHRVVLIQFPKTDIIALHL